MRATGATRHGCNRLAGSGRPGPQKNAFTFLLVKRIRLYCSRRWPKETHWPFEWEKSSQCRQGRTQKKETGQAAHGRGNVRCDGGAGERDSARACTPSRVGKRNVKQGPGQRVHEKDGKIISAPPPPLDHWTGSCLTTFPVPFDFLSGCCSGHFVISRILA